MIVQLLLVVSLLACAGAQGGSFMQMTCTTSNCGSCSSPSCSCEYLHQGTCYEQPVGGSGMAWCRNGGLQLRNYFVSANCTGFYSDVFAPLNTCVAAEVGWVEYSCPGKEEAAFDRLVSPLRRLVFPGPKFVPIAASFDVNRHLDHLRVVQHVSRDRDATLLTLHLGEPASHRQLPAWELAVGHGKETRLISHHTTLNVTRLIKEARGGPITLREMAGRSNVYVLQK